MRKIYMGAIVANSRAADGKFFDRGALRFFNDVPGNWDAYEIDGRVFIRNARHRHGPGAFSHCTLRGQWREAHEWGTGGFSMPIKEADGLTPKRFAAWLAEHGADHYS